MILLEALLIEAPLPSLYNLFPFIPVFNDGNLHNFVYVYCKINVNVCDSQSMSFALSRSIHSSTAAVKLNPMRTLAGTLKLSACKNIKIEYFLLRKREQNLFPHLILCKAAGEWERIKVIFLQKFH
jgi:hypothetical protein